MLNAKVTIAILAVMALAGAYVYSRQGIEPAADSPDAVLEIDNRAETDIAHPVSLQAMFEKDFNGHDFKVGQVLARTGAYTRYFITYESGEFTISGIMNVPVGSGPFPVLVLNHGYIDPAVYTNGRGLRREQDYLASRGYVVIHPDYRNHAQSDNDPDSDFKLRLGYVEDVINAVIAVQESGLPYINKEKIGMLGHSMGGGVTINTMIVKPELIRAAVLFAPVSSDYVQNFERWTRPNSTRRPLAERIVSAYGSPEANPEFWENVSAVNFFGRVEIPVMTHHGTADASVPLEWSQDTHAALLDNGKDSTLHIYPNEPHEFAAAWPEVMRRTVEFFDARLKI
ncbi:MAG: alpha/beta fold hydrolase [Candidatus Yanofskybacteria bacterium]|nr:alpha/beta fold hydrolase [Candidatus Yanofskybacteria bacterium]